MPATQQVFAAQQAFMVVMRSVVMVISVALHMHSQELMGRPVVTWARSAASITEEWFEGIRREGFRTWADPAAFTAAVSTVVEATDKAIRRC
jgi:hypothetical protein